MTEVFLDDERYDALVEALANLEPCQYAGRVTRDQISFAMAEAGIWPAVVNDDAVEGPAVVVC